LPALAEAGVAVRAGGLASTPPGSALVATGDALARLAQQSLLAGAHRLRAFPARSIVFRREMRGTCHCFASPARTVLVYAHDGI